MRMFLALEKLSPATLQDKEALETLLQAELYSHGDDSSLVKAAAWNPQQGLVAVVCYEEEPDFPHFYMLDCQTGELTSLDSSQLADCQVIEDIHFSTTQNHIDLDLVCTRQTRSVVYDLAKRHVQWS